MADFTHLHVHTEFSILDGLSNIKKLVARAKNDNMKALAITDHGVMYGVKLFHQEVKNAGIKPILGCETYVARNGRHSKSGKEDRSGNHLILLAKNKVGYQNLTKLISYSLTEGFYYKARIDWELLEQYHEGIIACSACLAGIVPQAILNGNMQKAEDEILRFKKLFGGDYYLEMQRHETNLPNANTSVFIEQQKVNVELIKLSKKLDVKLIASNDVHFVDPQDAEAHDRLICLNTNADYDDPKRMHYSMQEWLKTQAEMSEIFKDIPEAIENTNEIVDKIEEYELNRDAIMPEFEIPKEFGSEEEYKLEFTEEILKKEFTEEWYNRLGDFSKILRVKFESDYLASITYAGAKLRYPELTKEVKKRLDFELETIQRMGFPGYFLIVWDFLKAAREMGVVVGPGRGSAAGSVVAYCLKITDIDPMKYDLLFERFLNPDRVSMPDIDIDFDDDGRESVMQWVENKYGHDKVANIITFGTMAAKSVIRNIARIQKMPLSEADKLAKLVPDTPGTKLATAIKEVPELLEAKNSSDLQIASVMKYAEILEGTVRNVGVHACGVIIGKDPLIEHIPVTTSKDSHLLTTQFDGRFVESVGMLKMDFLGLKTLSIIKDAIENVKLSKGIEIDVDAIPLDDDETYELYSKGETTGLFQFESDGMKKHLKDLKPNKFEDLIAMNALYRPGPMEYIPDFIARKHGRQPIKYDVPMMEKYLKDTYGITVYQEQVMLLSRLLGNLTRGQSDSLRKAMGKKKIEEMNKLKIIFSEGCKNNSQFKSECEEMNQGSQKDIDAFMDEKINKIWGDWEAFAKYAFNKSHATCYSYVSYQTGYLKAHYPEEYMAAVLSRNLKDIKKISFFMDECKRAGMSVLGPNVNESHKNFTVTKKGDIRFGLNAIKGVGGNAVINIIEERDKNGEYTDVHNFVERLNLSAVNKRSLEALSYAGAFDCFDVKRNQYFLPNEKGISFIETLIRYGNKIKEEQGAAQQSLFGFSEEFKIEKPKPQPSQEWSNIDRLNKEKEVIGMFLSAHPLDSYKLEIDSLNITPLTDLEDIESLLDKKITVVGIITNVRSAIAKNGNPYGGCTIEDYTGTYTFVMFGKDYIEYNKFFTENWQLIISGTVQQNPWRKDEPEFKINKIDLLSEVKDNLIHNLNIDINLTRIDKAFTQEVTSLVENNPGKVNINFNIYDTENKTKLTMFSRTKRVELTENVVSFLNVNPNIMKFKISK